VDGAPTQYIYDANGDGNIDAGDKVYLYFGLRRGGTSYYALDVSDPESPKLLWRIDKGGQFAELGQTWSTPRIGRMLYGGSTTPRPVVIFAGGYDTNKDNVLGSTVIGTNDSMGNAIFVVNAETGALVWKAVKGASAGYSSGAYSHPQMNDSMPADTLALDTDGNGLLDRIYVGDTGGVVWRADMANSNQSSWIVTPVLSVGRHASGFSGSLANDRRFFNAPDYAQTTDATVSFDAVIIGTGDRENPKDTTIKNWFYMLKDRDITSSAGASLVNNSAYPVNHGQMADLTSNCLQNGGCTEPSELSVGWRMLLECPPGYPSVCGEKNLSTAFTLSGTIYFTTYIPAGSASSTCNLKEGGGLLYAVKLQNATAALNLDGTTVGLTTEDRTTLLTSGGIPAEVVSLGDGKLLRPDLTVLDTKGKTGYKSFWYRKK
jgi:type IV pilus assembly protein PilY1